MRNNMSALRLWKLLERRCGRIEERPGLVHIDHHGAGYHVSSKIRMLI